MTHDKASTKALSRRQLALLHTKLSREMSNIPFYVGCYTKSEDHVPNGCGKGIYTYVLNTETGEIEQSSVTGGITNPTYLHFDAEAGIVYAVEETVETQGDIISYSVNDDGSLTEKSRQSTLGLASCHIEACNDNIIVPSYASRSVASFAQSGGKLQPGVSVSYTGSGPNTKRQEAPHAHHAAISPNGKWVLVCDLGADKIWCHAATMPLPPPMSSTSTPPGSGPRHLVFHPTHSIVYVICELTGVLLVCKFDGDTGNLTITSETNSLPADYKETPSSACIRMYPSGEAVYVSNRGHDSIAVFPINASDGSLKEGSPTWIPCGGKEPRDFAIDPTGRWLIVGNQDDSTLSVFKIVSPCHVEQDSIKTFSCGTPACIAFPYKSNRL